MTPEVEEETLDQVGYIPEKSDWTSDKIRHVVQSSKNEKIPDSEVYQYLQDKGAFIPYDLYAAENDLPEDQVRQYIGSEYNLDTRNKPTVFQSALESLTGPIPFIADQLGIQPIADIKSLPGKAVAGALGAARSVLDAPENVSKAQYKYNHPEMSDEEINEKFNEIDTHSGDIIGNAARSILPTTQEVEKRTVAETSQPQSGVGQFLGDVATGVGAGAIGGPINALVGGGLTITDKALEAAGFSPYQRAAVPLFIGKAQQSAIRPSEITQVGPPSKPWRSSVVNKTRSKPIDSASQLAAKVAIRDPAIINFQVLEDLKSMGFDIANVPIQAYTEGGLANLLEGAQENSIMGSKKYNNLISNFTKDMTTRAENVLEGFPIEDVNEAVTHESLGEPVFENPVRNTFESLAPNLNLTRQEVGRIGTGTINAFDESMAAQARGLYAQSQFNDNQFIAPNDPDYAALQRVSRDVRRNFEGRGFIGPTREKALGILNNFDELFEPPEQPELPVILGPNGQPFPQEVVPENILYSDLRKNLNALNDTVDYEMANVMNLLEPLNREMRSIFRRRSVNEPELVPFVQAQEVFSNRARLLGDQTLRRLYNMPDEQFYNAMRKPSNLQAFRDFALETGNESAYDNLRGALIIKDLRPAFEANTPGDMARNISNATIEKFRDLQPFYPEYPDMANGLARVKNEAKNIGPEEMIRSDIREDAIQYQIDGRIPSVVLARMNNRKGINLVRSTLGETTQGRQLFNAFARKKIEQIIYDKTKKNEINIKDLATVFNDAESTEVLRALLPPKNFAELETLTRIAQGFGKGSKASAGMKRNFDKYILFGSSLTSLLMGAGLGAIPGATTYAGTFALNQFAKGIMSPNIRKAMVEKAESIRPKNET